MKPRYQLGSGVFHLGKSLNDIVCTPTPTHDQFPNLYF